MSIPIRFLNTELALSEQKSAKERFLEHPFFAWAGFRPLQAQHTAAEHFALAKYAKDRGTIVEIGVAEGASAVVLAENMAADGTLFLIDPFHLSRFPQLNFARRAAHRAVGRTGRSGVTWLDRFSHEVGRRWNRPIDFLLIDGDHREEAVGEDWSDWHLHLAPNGIAAFHDARLFPGGWTSAENGPVRFVDRVFRSNTASGWTIVEEIDSFVFVCRTQRARSQGV